MVSIFLRHIGIVKTYFPASSTSLDFPTPELWRIGFWFLNVFESILNCSPVNSPCAFFMSATNRRAEFPTYSDSHEAWAKTNDGNKSLYSTDELSSLLPLNLSISELARDVEVVRWCWTLWCLNRRVSEQFICFQSERWELFLRLPDMILSRCHLFLHTYHYRILIISHHSISEPRQKSYVVICKMISMCVACKDNVGDLTT